MRRLCGIVLLLIYSTLNANDLFLKQSDFDEYVNARMEQWAIPGAAIGIIKDGQVILAKGYGVRNIDTEDLVDQETLFPIASITKTFTATLLALSVDEGTLTWDDSIVKHLPEFQLSDPFLTSELTIRDALCHRSGLSRADYLWYQTNYTQDEVLHQLRFLKSSYSLRSRFTYNNILYSVLGMLEEKVSQDTWDNKIREKIFKPLEMSSSVTTVSDCLNQENIASSHVIYNNQLTSTQWLKFDNCRPAISIFSNVVDLCKWVSFQLRKSTIKQQEFLKKDTIEEMHRPQMILNDPAWIGFPKSKIVTCGLGWFVYGYQGHTIIEHSGNMQGASSLIAFLPEENLGIIVLTNRESITFFPRTILYHLLDKHLDQTSTDQNQFFLECLHHYTEKPLQEKENFEKNRKSDKASSLAMNQYLGEYKNSLYGPLHVKDEKGILCLDSPVFHGKLTHWHFNTFKLVPNQTPSAFHESFYITFGMGANGLVDSMTVQSIPGTDEIEYSKIKE